MVYPSILGKSDIQLIIIFFVVYNPFFGNFPKKIPNEVTKKKDSQLSKIYVNSCD